MWFGRTSIIAASTRSIFSRKFNKLVYSSIAALQAKKLAGLLSSSHSHEPNKDSIIADAANSGTFFVLPFGFGNLQFLVLAANPSFPTPLPPLFFGSAIAKWVMGQQGRPNMSDVCSPQATSGTTV
jgi:hypothetical protein